MCCLFSKKYSILYLIVLGILIFERVHDQIKLNLVYAIIQCSSDTSPVLYDTIPSCSTLQDAFSFIETDPALNELNNILVSNIKTYFYCPSCNDTPDSLRVSSSQIFIFKLSPNNNLIAYPLVTDVDNTQNTEVHCTSCDYQDKNIEMQVHEQIFIECPSCLIVSVFVV